MNLLVSTNVYKPGQLARVIPHLHAFRGQIGVELFPMFDADCYEEELLHCLPEFEGIPVSFHGPYYETEHSAAPGTPEYAHSMDLIRQTLPYCVRLQSQYLVFHHNNIPVTEERREEMIRVSRENYREIAELFKPHQIPVVVENAGVLDRGNMLFDQDAFIQLCREEHYPVLIDIGHAYANGWDLAQTMEALKDQIVAYHLHNNDGVHDSHQRIFHGTLDFPLFLSDYQRLTPNADLVLEYSPNVQMMNPKSKKTFPGFWSRSGGSLCFPKRNSSYLILTEPWPWAMSCCPERRNSSRKLKSAAGSLYSLPITPPKALRTTSKNSVRWVSQPILRIL